MKVIYLTKKKITNGMVVLLVLLIAGYLISSMVFRSLVIPTSEITPIYRGCPEKKQISLTINVDWGEEYIPELLNILDQHEVKVTFFLTGRWTGKFPNLAADMANRGHEIGNHGFSHSSPNHMSLEQNKEEIVKAGQIIRSATGRQTVLFAPPSGERKDHVLKAAQELGYKTVLWSIDTIDWKKPSTETIINRVMTKAHNGGIVLMHPTKPTLEALPALITQLKQQGYSFVTVSENISDSNE